jgi:hypothetical protein
MRSEGGATTNRLELYAQASVAQGMLIDRMLKLYSRRLALQQPRQRGGIEARMTSRRDCQNTSASSISVTGVRPCQRVVGLVGRCASPRVVEPLASNQGK